MSILPAPAGNGSPHEHLARAGWRDICVGTARGVQLLRGVHPHHRFDVQPARQWLKIHRQLPWRQPVASLNYLLSSTCGSRDNGFSHQDPGFIDHAVNRKGIHPVSSPGRQHASGHRALLRLPRPRQHRGRASSPRQPGSGPTRPRTIAAAAWASGSSPAPKSPVRSPTSSLPAPATSPRSKPSPRPSS